MRGRKVKSRDCALPRWRVIYLIVKLKACLTLFGPYLLLCPEPFARGHQRCLKSCFAAARAACVSTWLGEFGPTAAKRQPSGSPATAHGAASCFRCGRCRLTTYRHCFARAAVPHLLCRGDTRPARGSKLTLLSKRGNGRRISSVNTCSSYNLEPTVIASRAPHLLFEQSVMIRI